MNKAKGMRNRAVVLVSFILIIILIAIILQPQPPSQILSRYLKINADGKKISSWAGPWACVLDTQTHLLWEVKSDDESIHDSYWTYSWFHEGEGVENSGDCYFEKERCDTQDLVVRVNESQLCGEIGWRLPTTLELQGLVQHNSQPGKPKIANAYFPNTQRGDYWTSDGKQSLTNFYKYLNHGTNTINFSNGEVVKLPYRNAAFVRLVTEKSAKPIRIDQ